MYPNKYYKRRNTKKYNKKYTKRKRFYPKSKNNKPSKIKIKTNSYVPDRLFTKLKYDKVNITLVNAAPTGSVIFKTNDISNSPDNGVTTHKPLGFNQYMGLYSYYRVHASKINISVGFMSVPGKIGVMASTLTTAPATLQNLLEQPYKTYKIIATTVNNTFIKYYITTKKLWGEQSIQYDGAWVGTSILSPGANGFWHILGESYDGSANLTMIINVQITYWVEFFNRVELSQSNITMLKLKEENNETNETETPKEENNEIL